MEAVHLVSQMLLKVQGSVNAMEISTRMAHLVSLVIRSAVAVLQQATQNVRLVPQTSIPSMGHQLPVWIVVLTMVQTITWTIQFASNATQSVPLAMALKTTPVIPVLIRRFSILLLSPPNTALLRVEQVSTKMA